MVETHDDNCQGATEERDSTVAHFWGDLIQSSKHKTQKRRHWWVGLSRPSQCGRSLENTHHWQTSGATAGPLSHQTRGLGSVRGRIFHIHTHTICLSHWPSQIHLCASSKWNPISRCYHLRPFRALAPSFAPSPLLQLRLKRRDFEKRWHFWSFFSLFFCPAPLKVKLWLVNSNITQWMSQLTGPGLDSEYSDWTTCFQASDAFIVDVNLTVGPSMWDKRDEVYYIKIGWNGNSPKILWFNILIYWPKKFLRWRRRRPKGFLSRTADNYSGPIYLQNRAELFPADCLKCALPWAVVCRSFPSRSPWCTSQRLPFPLSEHICCHLSPHFDFVGHKSQNHWWVVLPLCCSYESTDLLYQADPNPDSDLRRDEAELVSLCCRLQ